MHDHAYDQHPAHADTSADADAPSSMAVPAQAQPQSSGQAVQPEGPPAPELLKRLRASYSAKPQHYQKPLTHLGAPGADGEAPPGMDEAAGTQLGAPGHGHASDAASSESAPGTDDTEGPPGTEAAPKRELPAALKARLMARGILKQGVEAGTTARPASQPQPQQLQQQQQQSGHPYGAAAVTAAPAAPAPAAMAPTAAAGSTEAPLPDGWFAAVDPTYHTTYYYNPATGERSWVRPAPALPPGWAEAMDPSSGVPYFFNASTGKIQAQALVIQGTYTTNDIVKGKGGWWRWRLEALL